MATYCKEYELIYFASPGTGSTSIEYVFLEQLSGIYLEANEHLFKYGTRHATFHELVKLKQKNDIDALPLLSNIDLNNVIKVTSIRNPFEYYYADWFRNRNKWIDLLEDSESWVYQQPSKIRQIVKAVKLPFSDWLIDQLGEKFKSGVVMHLNREYVDTADVVLRLENLTEDLSKLSTYLELDNDLVELKLNVTKKSDSSSPYWQAYSKDARLLIEKVFEPTLSKFGYKF